MFFKLKIIIMFLSKYQVKIFYVCVLFVSVEI